MLPTNSTSNGTSVNLPTFLGSPWCAPERSSLRAAGARCALLGAPIETHFYPIRSGTALGPSAFRIASLPYQAANPLELDVSVAEYWQLVDCGDVVVAGGSTEAFHQALADAAGEILEAGALPVLCGGDHSVPIAGVAALSHATPGRIGYLQLDAHLDIADEIGGVSNSMGSGLARVLENPNVDAANVAIVGLRGAAEPAEAVRRTKELGVGLFTMEHILLHGIDAVLTAAIDRVWNGVDAVYVSLDNDSLDASVAPGTTVPEPFGLTSRELLQIALTIGKAGIAMLDIAELSPTFDPAGITARIDAAFVLYVLAAYASAIQAGQASEPIYARKPACR